MANERTEQATPKRVKETRDKGQIAKSQDLSAALMLTTGCVLIYTFAASIMEKLKSHAAYIFSNLDPDLLNRDSLWGFLAPSISLTLWILLPIFSTLCAMSVITMRLQTGNIITFKALKPDFSKLNPAKVISNFKKFFNLKSLVELAKSLLKLLIISQIVYSTVKSRFSEIINLLGEDIPQALAVLSSIILQIMMYICIIYIVLGIIDLIYQRYEHEKSIKMTKQEVKDERKNAEGDPKIKQKIKNIQMKFAMARMMSSVPTADVVITNPTHYSIAVRYDTSKAPAPQVIAKGVDFVAFKIREIAKENNIPIVENKPLARTLYKIVPLEGLIPPDLYVAIAEVLAYVYKTNQGKYRR